MSFKSAVRTHSVALLTVATAVLTSCGGGGGGGGTQEVQVPGPQGRVTAQTDANTYCDFTNGSFTCYSRNQLTFQTCQTAPRPYSDVTTLCQSITQMQNDMNIMGQCNPAAALSQIYAQQNCSQILSGQNGTVNPNLPILNDPNMKSITCEFEAFRIQQGRILRREARTPKMTTTLYFNTQSRQEIDLRSKFLGFDIGHFGRTSMVFVPAGLRQSADTITLSNRGLNKTMTVAQSGFAGQPVQLEVLSDDGEMKLSVGCKSQSVFKKNITNKNFTKYVCSGTSSLYGYNSEEVLAEFPYNSSLLNTELNIAGGVTAVVTGDSAGADNARITFTAYGIGSEVSMVSSAYLKTTSTVKGSDGYANLNITCAPQ